MQPGSQSKVCPKCHAHNLVTAPRCQCGHGFTTQFTQPSPAAAQTVLGTAPAQPQQAVQQPIPIPIPVPQYQSPVPQGAGGFIQCYPGAISPTAGLVLGFFFPFLSPIYNKQWLKFGIYMLLFFTMGTSVAVSQSWQSTLLFSVAWMLSMVDCFFNSVALSVGIPITQTTFFGVPWHGTPQMEQAKEEHKMKLYTTSVLLGIILFCGIFGSYLNEKTAAAQRNENTYQRSRF